LLQPAAVAEAGFAGALGFSALSLASSVLQNAVEIQQAAALQQAAAPQQAVAMQQAVGAEASKFIETR
jgi:hypothetical protein